MLRLFLAALAIVPTATPAQPTPDVPIVAAAEADEDLVPLETDDMVAPTAPDLPVVAVAVPPSDTMPADVQKLIATAAAEGNEAAVATILALAKKAFPARPSAIKLAATEHDARVTAKKEADEKARIARLTNPDPLANWKGEVELGGSESTGNTHNLALYASAKAEREGLNWKHSLLLRGDLQRTDHVTTTERLSASWQPSYKFDDRLYTYGLGQYEHDRFLGFGSRYTLGGGIGYGVVRTPSLLLDFEGGPALRHTSYIDERQETAVAGRASVKLRWTLSPNLGFSQDASVFLEPDNNNAVSTTSLDTKLIGALKARFSYNIQYEHDSTAGRRPIDTLSRATLVYSF